MHRRNSPCQLCYAFVLDCATRCAPWIPCRQSFEAAELTLRSMKSTMLANATQILMAKGRRLTQGHHRDSALLYSRNDTFGSLHVQRTVAEAVADGFRPERSRARGAEAPLPEPPFSVSAQRPPKQIPHSELRAGDWALFTSRHEAMHSAVHTEDASPSDAPQATAAQEETSRPVKLKQFGIGHSIARLKQPESAPEMYERTLVGTAQGHQRVHRCSFCRQVPPCTDTATYVWLQDRHCSPCNLDLRPWQRLQTQRLR